MIESLKLRIEKEHGDPVAALCGAADVLRTLAVWIAETSPGAQAEINLLVNAADEVELFSAE